MVGTRKRPETLLYPVSEVAGRFGASVDRETDDEGAAYAGTAPPEPGPVGMPW
jgi:hypothetical protein